MANQPKTLSSGVIQTPRPPAGKLGLVELYALSIGQVIGAGVITLVGPALGITGYSAWLGYFMAIILGAITIFPIVLITSTVRMGGGYYSLIAATCGKRVTGMYAASAFTGMMSLSLFGVSLGVYVNSVFPSINPTLCGVVLLTFFYIVNLMGINLMAQAQKMMTWLLMAALFMFIVFGFMNIRNPIFDFNGPQFMTNGWLGLVKSMFLFVYSTTGYSFTMNYGRDAKNATRDIPRAILLSIPSITILYCGVAMAGSGALPLEQIIGQPLTLVAREIMPGILFAAFILGGPVMALTTTMNSSMPSTTIPFLKSCQDGWFPKSLGALNKNGAAWKILTLNYVLGLIPMLLGFNVNMIINNMMLLGTIRSMLEVYTFFQIPKRYPKAWANSKYHVSNGMYYFICTLSLVSKIGLFIYSATSLNMLIVMVSLAALAVCLIYGYFRSNSPEISLEASVWTDEDEDDAGGAAMPAPTPAE